MVLPDGVEREITLEADSQASVVELTSSLLGFAGVSDPLVPTRNGVPLPSSGSVGGLGLMHGDVIEMTPAAQPSSGAVDPAPAALELVAVGGPAIGKRWPLPNGPSKAGRAADCEIVIDDPSMSRAHLQFELEGSDVFVSDLGSTNGTFIDGVRLSDRRALRGEVLEAGTSLFSVQPAMTSAGRRGPDPHGFILFNRPPRVGSPADSEDLYLPPSPSDAKRARIPLASALVPIALALILWRLMPDNPSFLLIIALSPLMVVISYIEDRRRGRAGARREENEWRRQLEEVATALLAHRTAVVDRLRVAAPDAAGLEKRALSLAPELWQRRSADSDFLLLRCGWGDMPWSSPLRLEPGGSQSLDGEAKSLLAPLFILPSVPLTASIPESRVTGLCGERAHVAGLTRWAVVQLSTLHSPEEVGLVPVLGDEWAQEWRWLGWLPHTLDPTGDRSAAARLTGTISLMEARQKVRSGSATSPALVVILDGQAVTPRGLASRLVREGPAVGIFVLWIGSERTDLPNECGAIVHASGQEVSITRTEDGSVQRGAADNVDRDTCIRVVHALAPLRDAAPRSATGQIPRHVDLFQITSRPDSHITIADRWAAAPPDLRAPLGASTDGTFVLDFSKDGPHALVAGTTGAGKSELLQTLIASLSLHYPPTRLNLLLIDYKGGAAFKDCSGFPHAVGLVTDLDGRLAQRALVSLNAEIRRRETTLRGLNVRDLTEIEAKAPKEAPPRLLLIIDEFATLVKELPAFVDGVIDIAQRGRSLGIHLVLATQRPTGVVSDAVRANTNLRIALRVADEPDSEDVIGISAAAHIPRSLPGRAFVRRGHAEVEEIQTAFSGGPAMSSDAAIRVRDRLLPEHKTVLGETSTQLERAGALMREAAMAIGAPIPTSPWLPPLPDLVSLADLKPLQTTLGAFGLIDRPDLQARDVAVCELERDGHLLIYGAGGAGKTTLLRTLAASLAAEVSPSDLHIYAVDFGSGGLGGLQTLPHCGDVVPGEETSRVKRLFAMIGAEISRRKVLFASHGISDLAAWPEASGASPPRLVILFDGYPAFVSAFERIDFGRSIEMLPRYLSDGRATGVHFVITTDRRAAVPSTLSALIATKVVLKLADADDYLSFGLDPRTIKGTNLPPGRGFLHSNEFQAAVPGRGPSREDEHAALSELATRWTELGYGRTAPPAQLLPTSFDADGLPVPQQSMSATIGVREADLGPAGISLQHGHFLIAGPYRSGRSSALATVARSLHASTRDAVLHLMAPRRTQLSEMELWDEIASGSEGCAAHVDSLGRLLEAGSDRPVFVFIDDADELAEGPASYPLEPLVKRARDSAVRFVVAGESRALQRAFGGWLAELRKDKQGLILDPDVDLDGELFSVRLPRDGAAFPPGRGYLIAKGSIELTQVAL